MTGKPISPLRQRMIEDMTVRSFDPRTQSHYIRAVKKLAAFLGRSPDTANTEDLRRFQFHLRQTGVPAPTVNATVSALRFFFRVTVDRPEVVRHLAIVPKRRQGNITIMRSWLLSRTSTGAIPMLSRRC